MTTTPTYAVQIRSRKFHYTPQGWNCKRQGRPTDANLATDMAAFIASCQPGGVNAHLGDPHVFAAQVVHQVTGDVVATWNA